MDDTKATAADNTKTTLRAEHNTHGWHVRDTDSGIWWPNDETQAEIDAAEDPAEKAVEICDAEPMRGTWHC